MIMSVQSDVEILSIQALEGYARQHDLSTEEAVKLFYKHQVFEKILIQHEYLHQLDIEENAGLCRKKLFLKTPQSLWFTTDPTSHLRRLT